MCHDTVPAGSRDADKPLSAWACLWCVLIAVARSLRFHHQCTQLAHKRRDPALRFRFITAKIPRRVRIAPFCEFECTRTIFIGQRGDDFTYPWKAGRSRLHKFINFRTEGHGVVALW